MRGADGTVGRWMSAVPYRVSIGERVARVHEIMRDHRIHHLPVMDGVQVVGLVSEHDLHLMETLPDVSPRAVPVEDAMTPEPYRVAPSTALAEVATGMARRHADAAVVMDGDALVGIFTTSDALRALAAVASEA